MNTLKDEINAKALKKLAQFYGVQQSYINDFGKRKYSERHVLLAILDAMGCPINNIHEAMSCLEHDKLSHYRQMVEPVNVLWHHLPQSIRLYAERHQCEPTIDCYLEHEEGAIDSWQFRPCELTTLDQIDTDCTRFLIKSIPLPRELDIGYHTLTIRQGEREAQTLIIVAPKYFDHFKQQRDRLWGSFTPLYALKSHQNWGIGDTSDFKRLIRWQANLGGHMVGTLPLYANYLETPFDPSPYSPVSRLFFNEIYLDITAIPEFHHCAEAQAEYQRLRDQGELETLRQTDQVHYKQVYSVKKRLLNQLARYFFQNASPQRWQEFQKFLQLWPNVQAYAEFRAQPDNYQGNQHDIDHETYQLHLFSQWQMYEQINDIKDECQRQQSYLYLDLPVGSHPYGFDTRYFHSSFVNNISIGAPPDRVFVTGQNWGVTPFNPFSIRRQGYHYFILCLRTVMPFISMLRLDHIMQFHRLFWIPNELPAQKGCFVRYPAEEFYAILCLEAKRHQVDLIGENLGTVPQQVNQKMAQHHFKKMYVVEYELDGMRPNSKPQVPHHSIASLNTHDMPTFNSYCLGLDLKRRVQRGLIDRRQAHAIYSDRKQVLKTWAQFLNQANYLEEFPLRIYLLLKASLYFLAHSQCTYMLINFEDIWGETAQQNVPGTTDEYPNWRNKLRYPLEAYPDLTYFEAILRHINKLRRQYSTDKRV